jgi:hypothetical protein
MFPGSGDPRMKVILICAHHRQRLEMRLILLVVRWIAWMYPPYHIVVADLELTRKSGAAPAGDHKTPKPGYKGILPRFFTI